VWYHGLTLIEALDAVQLERRDASGPLRISILDEQQTDKGDKLASGKVVQGTVKIGEKLIFGPHFLNCQVKFLMNSRDEYVQYAEPGENVRLCLHGLEEGDIRKGYILCDKVSPMVPISTHILAWVDILNLAKNEVIAKGFTSMFHIHTVQEECFVDEIKEI
jgi:translation elongation factor EF-1alpha